MTRVAIIGAGASGLAACRAFQSAASEGADIPEIVVFEKQEDWGGLWNYTWRTGTDEYGEPVHCSMYRYLWSNGPKEVLEFADYSFEEHFGKPIASYPPREVLWDYIKGRVEKTVVKDWIRTRTPVRNVQYNEGAETFTVTVHDLEKDHVYSEDFDYVINASGHFSTPHVPDFKGLESFSGRVLHSHDFRDALEFKDMDIMVIGRSYSAEDIASQCWKYGCKSVLMCYRSAPWEWNWPDNFSQRPLLDYVEPNTRKCHFIDGSTAEVDAIIMCTGYQHYYPWLPDDLRLPEPNLLWKEGLYKGVMWQKNPKFFYIGAQDQYFTFSMFDVQGWWVRDAIMGKIAVPSQADMDAYGKEWGAFHDKAISETEESWYRFQAEYVRDVMGETDYPALNIDGIVELIDQWEHHKAEDIMGFRNNSYKSMITGKVSPAHHTPWKDAMDDSMESYLKNG